jgi:hypothetical protein
MPKGTRVDRAYKALRKKGLPKSSAAAIAQASTHQSLATGRGKTKAGKPVAPEGVKPKRRRKKKG